MIQTPFPNVSPLQPIAEATYVPKQGLKGEWSIAISIISLFLE